MLPEKKEGNQVPRLLFFSPPMGPTVRDPIYQEPIQSKNKLKLLPKCHPNGQAEIFEGVLVVIERQEVQTKKV